MFRVLTVASEFGAGGSIIARRAAEMLSWRLLDRSLTAAIARDAQADPEIVARYEERVEPWWRRFHRRGVWAAAITAGFAAADVHILDAERIAVFTQQAIARAATAGNCVIVGRGSQCVLRGWEGVFHVFVYGPWRERVRRVRDRSEPVPHIGKHLLRTDDERARYIRTWHGCDWKDPHLYQMMVSSGIGVENAAARIVDAVERACLV